MEYKRFWISNYRAISGPLEINVTQSRLTPIIGVNECGKTTILSAIFAFDSFNDGLNEGRHLRDTHNLYRTDKTSPTISAEISLHHSDLKSALAEVGTGAHASAATTYRRKRKTFPKTLTIRRDLSTRAYSFTATGFNNAALNSLIAKEFVSRLPYILYFDDFRDSIDETIAITGDEDSAEGWLSIVQQLFKQTDPALSVFDLAAEEERRRNTILAKVQRRLNETLTKEWQTFRLDDSEALEISIEFVGSTTVPQIKLGIIETDSNRDKHYFFIRDRSKGFFWFFNFVMKLEFNPKVLKESSATIYLLDEPGSYLHAAAQTKLCRKLQQLSVANRVIYCTHSHYLLDPEVIPLSAIKVAEKSGTGTIELVPIHSHKGNITDRRSAFQPVIDALQIKPIMLDVGTQCAVIVEGIYDFYSFELFRGGRNISIIPSVGADSVQFYISVCLAWHVSYKALWDNDSVGRKAMQRAQEVFGEYEANERFFLLPAEPGKNRILQDLFAGEDLKMMRENLQLSKDASFEKTIAALHFTPTKSEIVPLISKTTRDNFERVYDELGLNVA